MLHDTIRSRTQCTWAHDNNGQTIDRWSLQDEEQHHPDLLVTYLRNGRDVVSILLIVSVECVCVVGTLTWRVRTTPSTRASSSCWRTTLRTSATSSPSALRYTAHSCGNSQRLESVRDGNYVHQAFDYALLQLNLFTTRLSGAPH